MKLFLDTTVIIYLVEQTPTYYVLAANAIAALMPTEFHVNAVTRLECLVIPRRNANGSQEREFEDFFTRQCFPFTPIGDAVYDLALDLRAKYRGLKTPDALHLATAIVSGCDVFITNDKRLLKVTEIRVVRI